MDNRIKTLIQENEILRAYHAYLFGEDTRGRLFLDLSCGTRADIREVIEARGQRWIGMDNFEWPGIVNGDAHCLPFHDNSFDVVFSAATFEHYKNPWTVAKEVKRVLKPGGIFCGLIAFIQPWHYSYFHFSHAGTEQLLNEMEFEIVDIRPGDMHGTSYLIQQMFPSPLAMLGRILSVYATAIASLRTIFLKLVVRLFYWSDREEREQKLRFLRTDELRFAASILFLSRNKY